MISSFIVASRERDIKMNQSEHSRAFYKMANNKRRNKTLKGLYSNYIGITNSYDVCDSKNEPFIHFAANKNIIGKESSLSMSVDPLDTVVVICGILRNPVLNVEHIPCSITLVLIKSYGDIPANTTFTFTVDSKPAKERGRVQTSNKILSYYADRIGLTIFLKTEENKGELVWTITVPYISTPAVFEKPKLDKSIGNTADEVFIESVKIRTPKDLKLQELLFNNLCEKSGDFVF